MLRTVTRTRTVNAALLPHPFIVAVVVPLSQPIPIMISGHSLVWKDVPPEATNAATASCAARPGALRPPSRQ